MRQLQNWLEAYLKYTSEQESPRIFHQWVGVSIIASAMGRKAYHLKKYGNVFPNLYILLVDRSGISRKSTAIDFGLGILDRSKLPVYLVKDKITEAYLTKDMAHACAGKPCQEGFACLSEAGPFLSSDTFMTEMAGMLINLYDCKKYSRGTKTQGVDNLPAPCLNILMATTYKHLQDISDFAMKSGLMGRFLLIHGTDRQCKDSGEGGRPKWMDELQEKLAHDLVEIGKLEGNYELTEEALHWYEDWYYKMEYKQGSDDIEGYYERKHDYIEKVGMVMAAARSDKLFLETRDLTNALQLLEQTEQRMGEPLMTSLEGRAAEYVYRMVAAAGGSVEYATLMRRVHRRLDGKRLAEAIENLEGMEVVSVYQDGAKKRSRRTVKIVGKL